MLIARKSCQDLLNLVPGPTPFLKKLIENSCESPTRYVNVGDGSTKFGLAFPIQPEILHDIILLSKDKVVLELAAASGENSLLIGLAGAKEVYVNDIALPELKTFEGYLKAFSKDIRDKFHIVPGDAFQVFTDNKYTAMFDVIYARNFYHFFLGTKKQELHKLLARLLKPGGRLILTTNSSNAVNLTSKTNIGAKNPDCYIFQSITPLVRSSLNPGNDIIAPGSYKPLSSIEGEKEDPLQYKFLPLVKFINGQIAATPQFADLNDAVKTQIIGFSSDLLKNDGIYLKGGVMRRIAMQRDMIEIHVCVTVAYSQQTFPQTICRN